MMLHIYAQPDQHADAYIVGDAEALRALWEAIGRALVTGKQDGTGCVFCADGEGYVVLVKPATEAEMDRLRLPYTAESARDERDWKLHPDEMVMPEARGPQ